MSSSLISRRASYGLRSLCRLARVSAAGQTATAAVLAEAEDLPLRYLEQALRQLKQVGLVDSKSGPSGGYWLARPASEITVGHVVRALDGAVRPGHCLEPGGDEPTGHCPGCWGPATCALREVWVGLASTIDEVLDAVSIADLVARQAALETPPPADYQV